MFGGTEEVVLWCGASVRMRLEIDGSLTETLTRVDSDRCIGMALMLANVEFLCRRGIAISRFVCLFGLACSPLLCCFGDSAARLPSAVQPWDDYWLNQRFIQS